MKKGWERKKLKEIAEYTIGLTYSPSDVSEQGMVVLRSSNIQNGKIDLTDLVRVKKVVKPKLIVNPGDILMCSRNGSARLVGKTAVIPELDEEMTFGTFMTIIRSPYNPFLSYFFASDEFRKQITRGENPSIKQVTQYMLDDVEINLPPLPEQQRIVALLDETFVALNTVHANAERNLDNARDVFESILEETFTNNGKAWQETKLDELCEKITDGTHITPKYVPDGVPFLSVKDLTNGFIDFSNTRFITPEEHEFLTKRVRPERDDILYTKVGTTGIAKVVDVDIDFSIFVSVALLKIRHDVIYNKYLEYFLNSPFARKQAQRRTRGMANKNLVIKDIKEIEIHFPKSLDEQHTIVARLDALSAEIKRLEEVYQCKVDAVEELRKSILLKAFEGGL